MSKVNSGTIHVGQAGPTDTLLQTLSAADQAFVVADSFRFEGMASRFEVLAESRRRREVAAGVRDMTQGEAAAAITDATAFWRFQAGQYLLPTAWQPGDGAASLRILILNDAEGEALTVSQADGARTFDVSAGRLVSIRQACRFWLGPVTAEPVYLAVTGLGGRVVPAS